MPSGPHSPLVTCVCNASVGGIRSPNGKGVRSRLALALLSVPTRSGAVPWSYAVCSQGRIGGGAARFAVPISGADRRRALARKPTLPAAPCAWLAGARALTCYCLPMSTPRLPQLTSTVTERRAARITVLAGTLAAVVALMACVGWAADTLILTRLIASLPPMAPGSAVGVLCGAVALLLPMRRASPRLTRSGSILAAAVPIALGLVVLGQYLVEWILAGSGRLEGGGPWLLGALTRRPAANTGLGFVLIGLALVGIRMAHGEHLHRWAVRAAATTLVVTLAALIGYAYDAEFLYGRSQVGGMALPTAIALSALATGALFADPRPGVARVLLSDGGAGRFLRRLLPTALLLPALLGWVVLRAQETGLIDAVSGTSLLIVALMVIQAGVLVRQALRVHSLEATQEGARLEAEAANRAKSDFLATMSHELRTPLNAIGGYAQLIELGLRGPVTQSQAQDLSRIQRSQQHLLGLINAILNFTKLEKGNVHYDISDVPLKPVLGDVEALVMPQAQAKGLHLVLLPAASGLAVRADAEKLRQVLLNLLSNALKFTPADGRIVVSCEPHDDRVDIRVSDSGVGIATDRLAHVFEPFVQIDGTRTRTQEGVGLGLTISRDLARGMGGELIAESALHMGSTFTLVLPRA